MAANIYVYIKFRFPYIYDIYLENRTNEKWQLPFVYFKWKTETADFRWFAANENRKQKFFLLVQKTINNNR
jgi:hypothetical protein